MSDRPPPAIVIARIVLFVMDVVATILALQILAGLLLPQAILASVALNWIARSWFAALKGAGKL